MIRKAITSVFRRRKKQPEEPVEPSLGRLGERVAARELEKNGLRVLARNVETPCGEIDLVAMEGAGASAIVVFAEVKTRRKGGWAGRGEDAVDRAKQDRLARCASAFLKRSRQLQGRDVRFDVLAVEAPRGIPERELRETPDRLKVRWIQAAFHVDPRRLGLG